MKIIKEIIPYIIIIIVVIGIRTFIATPVVVKGKSMYPNLDPKQVLILEKVDKRYHRFDVVVLNANEEKLIKRIIGLPGEHIKYQDNVLYVNGKKVEETFRRNTVTVDFDIRNLGYEVLPNNTYLVMGDNRNNSLDSRTFGPVEKQNIIGKTIFSIYPFNRIGTIKK